VIPLMVVFQILTAARSKVLVKQQPRVSDRPCILAGRSAPFSEPNTASPIGLRSRLSGGRLCGQCCMDGDAERLRPGAVGSHDVFSRWSGCVRVSPAVRRSRSTWWPGGRRNITGRTIFNVAATISEPRTAAPRRVAARVGHPRRT
jgi:hypothetical protein